MLSNGPLLWLSSQGCPASHVEGRRSVATENETEKSKEKKREFSSGAVLEASRHFNTFFLNSTASCHVYQIYTVHTYLHKIIQQIDSRHSRFLHCKSCSCLAVPSPKKKILTPSPHVHGTPQRLPNSNTTPHLPWPDPQSQVGVPQPR